MGSGSAIVHGKGCHGKRPLPHLLARVAQIGYNSVEGNFHAPGDEKFYNMDVKAFAALLKQNGLKMPSGHYRLGEDAPDGEIKMKGTILHDWDQAVEDAHTLGLKYMVCAWLSPAERKDLDHYKMIAGEFNKAGEKCKAAGMQLCYHNHDFEFDSAGWQISLTIPYWTIRIRDLVKFEMDMYWVTKANQDPDQYHRQKHPPASRCGT